MVNRAQGPMVNSGPMARGVSDSRFSSTRASARGPGGTQDSGPSARGSARMSGGAEGSRSIAQGPVVREARWCWACGVRLGGVMASGTRVEPPNICCFFFFGKNGHHY